MFTQTHIQTKPNKRFQAPSVSPVSVPVPLFNQQARRLAVWRNFPYRSVEVSFPDGSCFQLGASDLAAKAATSLNGAEPMPHLLEQVVPLVQDYPEFLLEVAAGLSWQDARALACDAFWRSPCVMLAGMYKSQARMSLRA